MPRLFLALQPSSGERMAMQRAALPLVQEFGGRAIPAQDLHMTLCFLGEVPVGNMAALVRAVGRIEPVTTQITLDRIDWWRRSQVLCLLPDTEQPSLQQLAADLRDASLEAGLTPDAKPFRPHVTVARKAGTAAAGDRWPWPLPQALTFTADGLVLMQSSGGGDGPRYAVVHAWQSAAAAPRNPGS